jgi:hypothetical protein
MRFTRFATFLKFPGNKNRRKDFLYLGSFDPGPLTRGAVATLAGQVDQVGLGNAPADRLPVTGEGRPGTALRREKQRGEGSTRTRASPGARG